MIEKILDGVHPAPSVVMQPHAEPVSIEVPVCSESSALHAVPEPA
jgi:hypothetical protein